MTLCALVFKEVAVAEVVTDYLSGVRAELYQARHGGISICLDLDGKPPTQRVIGAFI